MSGTLRGSPAQLRDYFPRVEKMPAAKRLAKGFRLFLGPCENVGDGYFGRLLKKISTHRRRQSRGVCGTNVADRPRLCENVLIT